MKKIFAVLMVVSTICLTAENAVKEQAPILLPIEGEHSDCKHHQDGVNTVAEEDGSSSEQCLGCSKCDKK